MALLFNRKKGAKAYTDNVTMGQHPDAVLAVAILDDDIINELWVVLRVYQNKDMLDKKTTPIDQSSLFFIENPKDESTPTYKQAVKLFKGSKGEINVNEEVMEYAANSVMIHEGGQPIALGDFWELTDVNYKGVTTPGK